MRFAQFRELMIIGNIAIPKYPDYGQTAIRPTNTTATTLHLARLSSKISDVALNKRPQYEKTRYNDLVGETNLHVRSGASSIHNHAWR